MATSKCYNHLYREHTVNNLNSNKIKTNNKIRFMTILIQFILDLKICYMCTCTFRVSVFLAILS